MMKPNGIHIESKEMNTIEHIDGRGGTSVGPHLPASCTTHGVLLEHIATQAGAAHGSGTGGAERQDVRPTEATFRAQLERAGKTCYNHVITV